MEWDKCPVCGKKAPEGYRPPMCCSGHECGCMGLPTEPYFCSEECGKKFWLDSYMKASQEIAGDDYKKD